METIKIGQSLYNIEYSQEAADRALHKILDWMQEPSHYASRCGEGIMQNDDCLIDAPELIADIVDDILKPEFIEEV